MNISDHYESAASTMSEKMSEMGSEKEILEWKLYSKSDDVQAACWHMWPLKIPSSVNEQLVYPTHERDFYLNFY
jgi:hypothetical protein